MDPKTRVLPVGRTEVPVEGGKYTVVIDRRQTPADLSIRVWGSLRLLQANTIEGKVIVALTSELERCRDLLHKMRDSTHTCCEWEKEIDETLPPGYQPAVYAEKSKEKCEWCDDTGLYDACCRPPTMRLRGVRQESAMKIITVDNYAREGPSAIRQRLVAGPGLPREEAERLADEMNEKERNQAVFYAVVEDDRPLRPDWEP